MAKKQEKSESLTDKPKFISMILRLTAAQHAWIKEVAESAEQTQPNVISYILDQIVKSPTSDYIEEIGKIHKTKLREQLLIQEKALKEQLRQLDQALN